MKISRQSFLFRSVAALGGLAGVGAVAWQTFRKKPLAIPGELVGANAKIGHLLREGKLGVPTQIREENIVIVGSGIAGLSAARALQQAGCTDFTLLELEDHVGGNASSGQNAASEYPWGAHYLPLPNPDNAELLAFLREHNILTGYDEAGKPLYNDYYLCFDPEDRLYFKGHWQEGLIPHSGLAEKDQAEIKRFFAQIQTFREAKGADGKWAFTIPVAHCSTDEEFRRFDRLTMRQYLQQQGFQSPYLLWYLNYCCRDDYGSTLADTSAWAGIHYFAARKAVAANAESSAVLTWPEGNGFLVKQLRKNLDAQVQAQRLVYRVTLAENHVLLDTLDWKTNELVRIRAQKAILAVPQFVVQRMFPPDSHRTKVLYSAFSYSPWLVANLTLKAKPEQPSGQPLSWDCVFYDSPSLGYVYANHMHLEANPLQHVITYYRPLSDQAPKLARINAYRKSYAAWVEAILADLKNVHPEIDSLVERIDIKVWGHGMIRPTPGFVTGADRLNAAQPLANKVFFAHSDLSGISIFEEAFYHGNRAARELIQSLKSERQ